MLNTQQMARTRNFVSVLAAPQSLSSSRKRRLEAKVGTSTLRSQDMNAQHVSQPEEQQQVMEDKEREFANGGSPPSEQVKRRLLRHLTSDSDASSGETKKRDNREQHSSDELDSADQLELEKKEQSAPEAKVQFKTQLVWTNIILFVILHSCVPIAAYILYHERPWKTLIFSFLGIYASALGVTAGTHRLWSHRSYKASWPVQLLLTILQTMAGQNSIYTWSRDHRLHHKFSETDADPHNIKRGFFFAHMGWLCCRKHPEVKAKGKQIDMSDLEANWFVRFQHRHFWWMAVMFTVLVPTMIPVLLWGERFWVSFVFSFMLRYVLTLHGTWLVNSAAHYNGLRPYDTRIEARESPVVICNAIGEGFHNYHHTFPYDYATSEFGKYLNITTTFIDLCAGLGLVSDRRKVDQDSIRKRRLRTGTLLSEGADRESSSCSARHQHKSIAESDESSTLPDTSPLTPFNNIIHELPYISGLTTVQYTM